MKQYTDTIQTMRLKDLGFPSPKSVSKLSLDWDMDAVPTFDYSIGELIEMLPLYITNEEDDEDSFELCIYRGLKWEVAYGGIFNVEIGISNDELIDALFDMAVKLKEEGKI